MRLLVFTTESLHHAYFVGELVKVHPELHVICETASLLPTFDVRHPFEDRRDEYERRVWFGGQQTTLQALAETSIYTSVNQPEALARISELRPKAAVVFGARKLSRAVIEAAGAHIMNLHGGDPEYYRGLDTHLWAIYHNDYANLVTTLHVVNEVLDDGAIIGMRPIMLDRGMKLHELRRRNTECALRLTREALDELAQSDDIPRRAQRQTGRYYSFMPTGLKATCVAKFERYCANLI